MVRNCRCIGTLCPKLAAQYGIHRNKTFGLPRLAHVDHRLWCRCNCLFIKSHQITNKHHFGAIWTVRFGGVTHRLQIAKIQMFQPRQLHAIFEPCSTRLKVIGNFNNCRHSTRNFTKKFQTNGICYRWHLVQNPTRCHNNPIATLFLNPRNTAQKFIGDIFAQSLLSACCTRQFQNFFA